MTLPTRPPRPPSPWPGSRHETEHRWQLDGVRTVDDAVVALRRLTAELRAAAAAGWSLAAPMRDGYLLATRPSRRQRSRGVPFPFPAAGAAPRLRWRVRLVDEPPVADDEVLAFDSAARTPVLARTGGALRQVNGPPVRPGLLAELAPQVSAGDLGRRRWAVAPARVGPGVDLVAHGSALRVHAVEDGALVRTVEALTFRHAADRAATLPDAAAAYERLARATEAMAAAGGRLTGVDDGLLHVGYGRTTAGRR